jgi:hypothetical protein
MVQVLECLPSKHKFKSQFCQRRKKELGKNVSAMQLYNLYFNASSLDNSYCLVFLLILRKSLSFRDYHSFVFFVHHYQIRIPQVFEERQSPLLLGIFNNSLSNLVSKCFPPE